MNRYLDFFDPAVAATAQRSIEEAYARGARKVLLAGADGCNSELPSILSSTGFASFVERRTSDVQAADISGCDLLVICSGSSADVSRILHDCIGKKVEVIAPITDHHISKRTVFLMSIPKAGTHMLIRLLGLMGLERSSDRDPRPGTWCTPVGYEYHAPCRELLANDWFNPLGRHLFFRSPAIFVYRNPLDIAVSELDWFVKPEHSFSGYLNCCTDDRERLSRLIADDSVMGSIRDRINRYAGWMNFGNVIPVSYEELVGASGGGEDAQQADSIWALQLKLHIVGCPENYGRQLYDRGSATFSKGKIGRHKECFTDEHWTALDTLPQDFMRALGYTKGSVISSRVDEVLKRPLAVKQLSIEQLYTPKLVREDYLGWNIVEIAGQYFPVKQGHQIASPTEAMAFSNDHDGFVTIADAKDSLVQCIASRSDNLEPSESTGTVLSVTIPRQSRGLSGLRPPQRGLFAIQRQKPRHITASKSGNAATRSLDTPENVKLLLPPRQSRGASLGRLEGFSGFNVVQHNGSWYAFAQATGPLDIAGLDARAIEAMKSNGQCVTGESIADVKAEVLRVAVQEQLGSMKEQQESAVAHGAETDQRLAELRAHIEEAQLRSGTELKSVQEQLGRIVNNPFVRMSRLMYRSLRSAYRFVFRGRH